MKLYFNPASPFARKVAVVLAETGQSGAVEIVNVAGHPTDSGTMPLSQNPLGKLPTLVRDDGPAIYDSRVICRYLNDIGKGHLYPTSPRQWETLTLEATGDGIMDAAILMVYETRSRPEDKHDPAWVEGQWAKVTRALDALEERWMAHLAGPLDIGIISVACALGYLDFRQPGQDWRATRPALAAWFAAIGARDSFADTAPQA
ncbi:glutathione S-transferase [Oceanibium sediminis]|uniref:glutathione S-transferase n=1 Tax=Oceanibium sediminis TaxID=2026339 RepID=UPI000DD3BA5A|nr:glutathione S-transferase [Oceanibium sediminis]